MKHNVKNKKIIQTDKHRKKEDHMDCLRKQRRKRKREIDTCLQLKLIICKGLLEDSLNDWIDSMRISFIIMGLLLVFLKKFVVKSKLSNECLLEDKVKDPIEILWESIQWWLYLLKVSFGG